MIDWERYNRFVEDLANRSVADLRSLALTTATELPMRFAAGSTLLRRLTSNEHDRIAIARTLVGDGNAEVQIHFIVLIGLLRLNDPTLVEELRRLVMESHNSGVQLYAVRTLGVLGDVWIVDTCDRWINDGTYDERVMAVAALSFLKSDVASERLDRYLNGDALSHIDSIARHDLQTLAAQALLPTGNLRAEQLLEEIVEKADDVTERVHSAVVLARNGKTRGVHAILDYLNSGDQFALRQLEFQLRDVIDPAHRSSDEWMAEVHTWLARCLA